MRRALGRGISTAGAGLIGLPLLLLAAAPGRAGTGQAGGTCADCHSYMSSKSQRIVTEWKGSVHGAVDVGCADCHGGDPKAAKMDASMSRASGFIGAPKRTAVPRLCARCHSDPARMRPYNLPTSQFDQYQTSVHGRRLRQGDTRVAVCTDCHSVHDIRRKNDVLAPVYKTNIADTCGRCHANKKLMKPYGIPTDQHAEYLQSVHGQKLVKERDIAAPSCADCHGTHGATPPGVKQIAEVCGRCHPGLEEQFSKGPHSAAVDRYGTPRCVDCHGNHGVKMPSDAMLISDKKPGGCGSCHPKNSPQFAVARQLHEAITGAQDNHDRALAELERVASLHEDVADGRAALAEAHTSLKEARANVHAVSLKAMSSQVENAGLAVKKADDVAREGASRSYWRRSNVGLLAFIFLSISVSLFIKWSHLHRRWLRQAGISEDGEG